jgi:putative ABC transport system permease protein
MRELLTRVSFRWGQWTLVALLGAGAVGGAAAAMPVTANVENHGLRHDIAQATWTHRDLVLARSSGQAFDLDQFRHEVMAAVPNELGEVAEVVWAYQFTQVSPSQTLGLQVTGDGVTTEPDGLAPYVALHAQPGIGSELTVIEGAAPATDTASGVAEVMVEATTAQVFGLEVGGHYDLSGYAPDTLEIRISGTYVVRDAAAPVWDHAPRLREHGQFTLACSMPPCQRALRADLLTDQGGFEVLFARDMYLTTEPRVAIRARLDGPRLESAWVPGAREAVARLHTDPELRHMALRTQLATLLAEVERQAAAVRAVLAVAAAGLVSILVGLLVLAAWLSVAERREELILLRARGGSLPAVGLRLAAEAAPAVLLAAAGGWLLSRWAAGQPVVQLGPGSSLAVLTAVLVWLLVPAAAVAAVRRSTVAAPEPHARRAAVARLSIELSLLVLAGVALLLVYQRGLSLAGVDPYLSAAPVLLAVAGGLVALRLYPLPMRLLATVFGRMRGAVGFLGLARAGRAAPGASVALLVLVLAVAIAGFAWTVDTGVSDARDDAAIATVGADVRLSLEAAQLPHGLVEAVEQLPGVETVAVARRGGVVRHAPVRHDHGQALLRRDLHGPQVVAVDMAAYQEILTALGLGVTLPPELLSAEPDTDPLPVLAPPQVAERNEPSLQIGDIDRPVTVVGDVAGLPGPDRDRTWVLVPRQAWPEASAAQGRRQIARVDSFELLISGDTVDPAAVTAVAEQWSAGQVTVSSRDEVRTRLDTSGFNLGITLALVAAASVGLTGCLLAVGLALVLQARSRGRMVSLLRTMGLSSRQARGLLLIERIPLTTVAVAAGAVLGATLPLLLGPALGLDSFTGGLTYTLVLQPVIALILAALVLLLVAVGALLEATVNRRLRIGGVLRVGN